jgi:hypothetical protein
MEEKKSPHGKVIPDLLLSYCELAPIDDSSKVNLTGRFGSIALHSQRSISYYLNGKIKRVTRLEILLKGLWLRRFVLKHLTALSFTSKTLRPAPGTPGDPGEDRS